MEPRKQPKQTVKKSDNSKASQLKTEAPISEKDEVKQAEDRTKGMQKKH